MPGLKDACPYDARTRAARCSGCVQAHGGVTPCIIAWLNNDEAPAAPRAEMPVISLKAA